MAARLADDCFITDRPRLSHDAAIAILADRLVPIAETEPVDLDAAGGRILAEPVAALRAVPAHANSAVDGYAFAHDDLGSVRSAPWPVIGRAAAGHPHIGAHRSGHAVRIFTGAVMPAGTDTVVMQEDVELIDGEPARIRIRPGLKRGANVRRAGEDVAAGETLFNPGALLRPQDLAALAALGRAEVTCYRRLRIAVVSTGDEVVRPGARDLAPGEVFDANAPMLRALADLAGGEVADLGVWRDDAVGVQRQLAAHAPRYDAIVTTGGASKGEEDHMAAALEALGTRHVWQLAIKPGRPIMFGQIGGTVVVGLPGNPVAVLVCFLMYVHPLLRRLGGAPWREPRRYALPAAFTVPSRKTDRREFWRGMLITRADGTLAVDKFARDGSGLISGLRAADGLIDIPEPIASVQPGDPVAFIPFAEFGIIGH